MLMAGNTKLGGSIFGTAPLTFGQVSACWGFGAFSLIINIVAKKVPIEIFNKFTHNQQLESERPTDFVSKTVDRTTRFFDNMFSQKDENDMDLDNNYNKPAST